MSEAVSAGGIRLLWLSVWSRAVSPLHQYCMDLAMRQASVWVWHSFWQSGQAETTKQHRWHTQACSINFMFLGFVKCCPQGVEIWMLARRSQGRPWDLRIPRPSQAALCRTRLVSLGLPLPPHAAVNNERPASIIPLASCLASSAAMVISCRCLTPKHVGCGPVAVPCWPSEHFPGLVPACTAPT